MKWMLNYLINLWKRTIWFLCISIWQQYFWWSRWLSYLCRNKHLHKCKKKKRYFVKIHVLKMIILVLMEISSWKCHNTKNKVLRISIILIKCKEAYDHLKTYFLTSWISSFLEFPDFMYFIMYIKCISNSCIFLVKVANISDYTCLPSGKMEITFLQNLHMKIEMALRKVSHQLSMFVLELKQRLLSKKLAAFWTIWLGNSTGNKAREQDWRWSKTSDIMSKQK